MSNRYTATPEAREARFNILHGVYVSTDSDGEGERVEESAEYNEQFPDWHPPMVWGL